MSATLTTRSAPARPRRRSDAGFTMVEVMVAAVVLGIGLIGILGMQSTAAIANRRAYDMRAGMELAETTLERLKRDGIGWTASPELLPRSTWLGAGLDSTNESRWIQPPVWAGQSDQPTYNDLALPNATSTRIPAASREMAEKSSRYCVQYRLTWVIPNQLARADVRVFWPNNRAGERAMAGTCNVFGGTSITEDRYDQFFEWVRVSGMVRWNQLGAVPVTPVSG